MSFFSSLRPALFARRQKVWRPENVGNGAAPRAVCVEYWCKALGSYFESVFMPPKARRGPTAKNRSATAPFTRKISLLLLELWLLVRLLLFELGLLCLPH